MPTNFSGSEGAEWDSAYISHIGQIFFQDAIGDTVHEYPPYSTVSNASVTYLDEDNVYAPTGDTTLIGDYTPVNPGSFAEGAVVAIQAVVGFDQCGPLHGGLREHPAAWLSMHALHSVLRCHSWCRAGVPFRALQRLCTLPAAALSLY